ncbi:MAG: VWA domain-containing protein [Candidatus Eremiobacteraeota bacterium]|nr:VWA domain-containing protein [Candidatus Eremiobacteraeota bacterium]
MALWQAAWPQALDLWSRYVRLSEPRWCLDPAQERAEGMGDSIAMIRLNDQVICVSFAQIERFDLDSFALVILAHEIGHHVYTPGDLIDLGRCMGRVRAALPTLEDSAPMICNIYEDLLINDRLHRFHSLDVAGVYQAINRVNGGQGRLWNLMMRIFEILWSLQRGTLAKAVEDQMEGDAQLGARLIRNYAQDWVEGCGPFALLCLPYLLEDKEANQAQEQALMDALKAGAGAEIPGGLVMSEGAVAVHPAELGDQGPPAPQAQGQCREPFEFGALLRALGMELSDEEVAARYYRERALPYLIPFPTQQRPETAEPLMEGLESWDIGFPLEDVDWLESVMLSPRVVPGVTTVQRVWGTMDGTLPDPEPIDLDLYVDCSGSMPDPRQRISYLTLAGAIVAISCLRAGGRVQVTLWSGPMQFITSDGFVRNEKEVMATLTAYLNGSTAFPLHMFRKTYSQRKTHQRPVHILIISDDGVDTIDMPDELGNPGLELARMALEKAGAGGTMVLHLWANQRERPFFALVEEMGWRIFEISQWEDLVAFARDFARERFELQKNLS